MEAWLGRDRIFINHEGRGAGFTSETRIYPNLGLGLVIMMNRMSMPDSSIIAHRICEAMCKIGVN